MRVNHAGEHGAVSIYTGQLFVARFLATPLVAELTMFRSHEQQHRAIFARELERRGLAHCKSYQLCALGGFALGIMTGLLGARAISVTTVAVEKVVLRHLQMQLSELGNHDPHASTAISAILAEEQLHHDQARRHLDSGNLLSAMLTALVSTATESVIWLGMRI